jgi:predicted permease
MPDLVNEIISMLASIIRMIGMVVVGLGLGWLGLDLLRKLEAWQGQVIVFLGLLGIVIAMAVFLGSAAMGMFATGVGVAVFLWGMPKKPKEEKK